MIEMTPQNIPIDWLPILDDISTMYIPYLNANAKAFHDRRKHFDVMIENIEYRNIPTSRYRVYCLEKLRYHFRNLDKNTKESVKHLLSNCKLNSYSQMFNLSDDIVRSGHDIDNTAPFCKGLGVFSG